MRNYDQLGWGGIHVRANSKVRPSRVKKEILRIYAEAGLYPLPAPVKNREIRSVPDLGPLALNREPAIGEDDIMVVAQDNLSWIAVASRRYEWTPAGKNFLARELSAKWDVVVINFIYGMYTEYALYSKGRLAEISLLGEQIPQHVAQVPAFNFQRLTDDERGIDLPEITSLAADPEALCLRLGLDVLGHHQMFESVALEDYPRNSYFLFRRLVNGEWVASQHTVIAKAFQHVESLIAQNKLDDALEEIPVVVESIGTSLDLQYLRARARALEKAIQDRKKEALTDTPAARYNSALEILKSSKSSSTELARARDLLESAAKSGIPQAKKLLNHLGPQKMNR